MREILFRGRKTGGSGWAEGSLILADDYCCILESEDDVHPMDYPYLYNEMGTIDGKATPVIPETVGQYTGLTDKNGKKIFEGDIIKFDYIGKNLGVNGVSSVIFENCQFGVKWGLHKDLVCLTGFANTTLEVIGNIHDNPELLKGGADR